MKSLLKLFVALILLPTLFFALIETGRLFGQAFADLPAALCFVAGALVYSVLHRQWYSFSRMYVFGHEMTHALAALCCGYRVHDISVKENSGYVKINECNSFVALAPYFVPFYTLITAFIYVVISLFTDLAPYRLVFVFLVGMFTAFHFIHTFATLFETDQPDLKLAGGKIFSVISITFFNLIVLVLVLKGLFGKELFLWTSVQNVYYHTIDVWARMGQALLTQMQAPR